MWKWYEIQILVPINKVLLEHSHALCLYTVHGCFGARKMELSGCDRDDLTCKLEIFTLWPFTEKICWPPFSRLVVSSFRVPVLMMIVLLENIYETMSEPGKQNIKSPFDIGIAGGGRVTPCSVGRQGETGHVAWWNLPGFILAFICLLLEIALCTQSPRLPGLGPALDKTGGNCRPFSSRALILWFPISALVSKIEAQLKSSKSAPWAKKLAQETVCGPTCLPA